MFMMPLFEPLYISQDRDLVPFKTTIRSGVISSFARCFQKLHYVIVPNVTATYRNCSEIDRRTGYHRGGEFESWGAPRFWVARSSMGGYMGTLRNVKGRFIESHVVLCLSLEGFPKVFLNAR